MDLDLTWFDSVMISSTRSTAAASLSSTCSRAQMSSSTWETNSFPSLMAKVNVDEMRWCKTMPMTYVSFYLCPPNHPRWRTSEFVHFTHDIIFDSQCFGLKVETLRARSLTDLNFQFHARPSLKLFVNCHNINLDTRRSLPYRCQLFIQFFVALNDGAVKTRTWRWLSVYKNGLITSKKE